MWLISPDEILNGLCWTAIVFNNILLLMLFLQVLVAIGNSLCTTESILGNWLDSLVLEYDRI